MFRPSLTVAIVVMLVAATVASTRNGKVSAQSQPAKAGVAVKERRTAVQSVLATELNQLARPALAACSCTGRTESATTLVTNQPSEHAARVQRQILRLQSHWPGTSRIQFSNWSWMASRAHRTSSA